MEIQTLLKIKNRTNDGFACSVAILHDVVEDTEVTLDDLFNANFNNNILYALNLLTHNPNVSYMDYILNLAHNNLAREVKLRDLEHNSKITRLKGLRDKDFQRLQKYQIAYDYLKNYKSKTTLSSKRQDDILRWK